MYVHAYACTLSKLDSQVRAGANGPEGKRDLAAAEHFMDFAELEIENCFGALYRNCDESMLKAAETALSLSDTLPNDLFIIPERAPDAEGTGREPVNQGVKQFPGDKHVASNTGG